jgi:hypothetical protein
LPQSSANCKTFIKNNFFDKKLEDFIDFFDFFCVLKYYCCLKTKSKLEEHNFLSVFQHSFVKLCTSEIFLLFLTAEAVLVIAFTPPHPPPTPLQFRKKLF